VARSSRWRASWFVAALTAAVAFLAPMGCSELLGDLTDDEVPPREVLMRPGLPAQWSGGGPPAQFEVGEDFGVQRNGEKSAYIRTLTKSLFQGEFATLAQSIRADAYRGTRVRFSGWVRTSGISGEGVGLWLRSDGGGEQPFDNMFDRRITETTDWRELSIVADIPEDAIGLVFGVIAVTSGVVWADDLRLEVVDTSVPLTAKALPMNADTALLARTYDRLPMSPRNLDFEGVRYAAGTPDAVNWVREHSFAFATDDPAVPSSDLDPLRNLVGSATIVALGEATHGTREFFRMKHRMLEWLVREMGFSYFAIEAAFPEALAVDHYLQTGEGDGALSLANLHFWTWNTAEVLSMIEWMRSWNAAGKEPKLHFVGIDMQFPGVAVDSVEAIVKRMDAGAGAAVHDAYLCLTQFRITPSMTGSAGFSRYQTLAAPYKKLCRMALQDVDSLLAQREAEWSAREGAAKMRLVRRFARLVSQWEEANAGDMSPFLVRERSMAENVSWWHDTQAPGAKMVVWAHNNHVSRTRTWMGDHLSKRYGAAYLNVGQTFGSGSFNAVPFPQADTSDHARPHSVSGASNESIEAVFLGTELPLLVLDARRVRSESNAATASLSLPMSIRSIGATFNPLLAATAYRTSLVLANDYDLIVWFQNSTPTVRLPFPPFTPP
jgi:erythromycin esterase